MKRIIYAFLFLMVSSLLLVSCSEDDDVITSSDSEEVQPQPFVAAFFSLSSNLTQIDVSETIDLVYSTPAETSGSITIMITSTDAAYGPDFTTQPAAVNNTLTIPINQGESGQSFVFNKLNASLVETAEIKFTITAIDHPNSNIQGNTEFLISNSPSLGRAIMPNVGGPNQPNQVYIDLSTEKETNVRRDSWDLGFYSQDGFRVGINASIYMAAKELDFTDIDAVTEADVADLFGEVAVGTFDPVNEDYIDNPNGDILDTAFTEVKDDNNQNKVYLLNLGFEVGTQTPDPGSVAVAGDERGWRKVRVLKQGDGYLLQYANLNDTSHQEITINKSAGFNFTFFSFNTNSVISVEPEAQNWDINFSVFTNILEDAGSYGFADGVLHNRKAGVRAYEVLTKDFAYNEYTLANVNNGSFLLDQRAIGANWRDVFEDIALDDRFYVLEDPNGNIYKIKFLGLTNDSGERGYPEFEYELLQ